MSTDRLAGEAASAPEEAEPHPAVPAEPDGTGTPAPGGPGGPATAGTEPDHTPDDHSEPGGAGAPSGTDRSDAGTAAAGQGGADDTEAPTAGTGGPHGGSADREPTPPGGHGTSGGPEAGQDSEGTQAPGPAEASADAAPGAGTGAPAAAGQGEPGGAGAPSGTDRSDAGTAAAGQGGADDTKAPTAGTGGTHGGSADGEQPPAGEADGPATEAGAHSGSGDRERAAATPGDGAGEKGRRSAAAEALAAAVRAVESGERSAASFFNDAPARRPAAPTPTAPAGPVRERPRTAAPAPAPAPVRPPSARPAPGPGGEIPGSGDVRQVLAAGGAPESLAGPVAETLGERAAETLREDPWQLLAVPGVRPDQADGFARALLGPACEPGDERRALALTGWLLERAALEGHTALESSTLRDALAKVSVPDPDEALRTAIAEGAVLVFQDALDAPPGARPQAADDEEAEQPVRVLLGLDRYALAEESLADALARMASTFVPPQDGEPTADGPGAPEWESAAAATPTASAAELIRTVAAHGLVTHSGGEAARDEPAALVAAARALGLRAYAAAHSEDGRRRLAASLSEAPGADPEAASAAVTVAGLLADAEGPGRDEEGALALDLLAVLDAPQLDVETAAMLVESLPDGARLVLSGDPGVLWSAGPGRVFADLVAARRCPQVVSRTPDPGPIGELVSGIGIGELNQVEAPGKEVVIVPVRDAGEAVHRTVQLVADSVPRAIGIPAEQTQVITPGHGGAAGTRALNAALKTRLNPGPGQFGGFDPGDRVAYTPAPGRTVPGTVVSADAEGLRLDCAGGPVVVPRTEVGELVRHGWALTAHQAAGARWPAAVVVLPGDATAGLTRAWIYTAFSRGERHLSVVHGAEGALPRAVAEIPFKERTTRLRALLQAQVPAGPTG
ncbi:MULTISPECIES: helix-hairpin-helix domain-containing protein [Streptomyces violaceusniger group]|uniref:Helix-hairpin-helix domain-containing protein n=1 Tax=Streptomyces antimycoticus TaxID=68175 RepID=A0ABD5JP43_9ACTN|nr:helix-hairpin-helix domain-containing protein [Streptomyces violaceusniger]MEE4588879.1 helix-hairpin-helix domain-containing protein [Streptomyces sp. DSM 41602]